MKWTIDSFDYTRSVTICTNHNGTCKTTCAMYNVKHMKKFYRKDPNMEWEDIMIILLFLIFITPIIK